ncbi:50S ribosomal protein L13 [Candidatus Peregrinibacteria bacterium]|nr:50S ribosomal protein L13 [Candidatus Peregrinibacteria bacterium]
MKTFSPKKEAIERKWYLVDLKGKTLGRASTVIANLLRGKDKPIFSPHVDCGDFVIVINAKDIHTTGNKVAKKEYHRHSGYPRGHKVTTMAEVLEKHPERVVEKSIAGMIPNNKLKKDILKKLKVFADADHKHEAQTPTPLEI